jgi:hypothetical protein
MSRPIKLILVFGLLFVLGASTIAAAEVLRKSQIQVAVSGGLKPKRLPRHGAAPISASVGGKISSTDESPTPRLKSLAIELNRNGRIETAGLPLCPYDAIQPASTQRALSACRSALVGKGSFEAEITFGTQEPYGAKGRLLAFNGRQGGKPVLFAQIYSPQPFATSFVIVFKIQKISKGSFGTRLLARLPASLGSWGKLTGIELNLSRRYSYRGHQRSYLSAGCPAPPGGTSVVFPYARTSFGFEGGRDLDLTLVRSCSARGR